ncbi:receptor kinase-like protein Xa21 [Hibiscus syriacus]|uniref:receptor kinase-like protein Xa21 n=1 Tax=Hibiscus syriacus TaxID=106335 RepID=UPI001924C461|nr:receptor kinase-like protein Xa21 [Hibiscus syriacus]
MAMETGGMMGEDDDDDEDGDRFLILDDGDARGEEGVQAADVEKKEGGEAGKVAGAGGGIVLSPKNGYSSHGYHPFHSQFKRLNIAIDVASSLDYLHSQFGNPVVHCDLKPTNILLNTDLTAHVTDFGLTRFLSETTEQSSLMGIKGTNGYIPPEYGMGMEISTHGDVYSYGIVLTELFTGKRPTDSMFTGELSLRKYIKTSMPDHVTVIVDTWFNFEDEAAINQNDQSSTGIGSIWKCLASVLKIGVSCSADWSSECAERTSQGLRVKMVGHEAVEEETFAERTEREMGKNDVDILCLAI